MKPFDRWMLLLVALASLAGLAMTFAGGGTAEQDLLAEVADGSAAAGGLDEAAAAALATAMEDLFGGYRQPKLPPGGLPGVEDEAELTGGRSSFAVKCAQCHGSTGAADTGTARLLKPRPRSFRLGQIKFTSTADGEPPVRADLERLIRDGVPTTSMAGFPTLPESARRQLTSYAQYLLMRGATELAVLQRLSAGELQADGVADAVAAEFEAVREAWRAATPAEPPVPAPPAGSTNRDEAKKLFATAGCTTCHGDDGGGRGPVSFRDGEWLLRDAWGNEARPRSFADGVWFGGSAPEDLYRRIAFGVKGTPMAAHAGALTPEQIWSLVDYVQSFAAEDGQ